MTDAAKIKAAAAALFADNQTRRPYRPLADALRLVDLDEAQAAQDEYNTLLGAAGAGPLAGYKIALTSAAMQQMVGLDRPCIGSLFANVVHTSPAALRRADYRHLGIECEMAVRLARDLPAGGAPYDRDQVRAAVGACLPAFELIEDRDADYCNLDAMSLIAENCWNAGVVLGDALDDWRALDLVEAAATLEINGAVADRGRTGNAMGHPLEVVAWLANSLAARGRALEAGMIVMTGSVVTTKFPAAGDRATFTIADLGSVDLTLSD